MIKFSDLKPGDTACVVGFGTCDKAYLQRLLAMGLTRGAVFQVLRKAPLGDPFHIQVRGSSLSLRKEEADGLEIALVETV